MSRNSTFSDEKRATISASEDMDVLFVLADRHAPTPEEARLALLTYAPVDWDQTVDAESVHEPDERHWYKWGEHESYPGEQMLVPCAEDDPERDSEWWLFKHIAPGEWDWVKH